MNLVLLLWALSLSLSQLNGFSSDRFGTITSSLHPLGELLPLILVYPAVAMLLLSYDKSFKITNMWG